MLFSLLKSIRPSPPPKPQYAGAFAAALSAAVAARLHAAEENNVDVDRYRGGDDEVRKAEQRLCELAIADLLAHPAEYERAYELFADEGSRSLYVQLVAFRLLGHAHVRLPSNRPEHWEARARAQALPARPTEYSSVFGTLSDCEVDFAGERIALSAWPYNVAFAFFLRQYYFERGGVRIQPREGDRVIDAGAFIGETALAFAASVGATGRVASFEIEPTNVHIARRNIARNPHLAGRVDLRECALAERKEPLYLVTNGPGSYVTDRPTDHPLEVETIDGLVQSGALDRVDFIKMDIEGAEGRALAGARETLRRDRPALAISIYHCPDDLWKIALFIDGLNAGYRFYLDHYTIHNEETVLYASAG